MTDIQPGRGFIEQHNCRFLGQHHCDPRSLALSARKGIHALICQMSDSRGLHRFRYRFFILFAPAGKQRLMRVTSTRHQLLHGDIARRGSILRQQTNPACNLFTGVMLNVLTIQPDMPVSRRHQAA